MLCCSALLLVLALAGCPVRGAGEVPGGHPGWMLWGAALAGLAYPLALSALAASGLLAPASPVAACLGGVPGALARAVSPILAQAQWQRAALILGAALVAAGAAIACFWTWGVTPRPRRDHIALGAGLAWLALTAADLGWFAPARVAAGAIAALVMPAALMFALALSLRSAAAAHST